MQINQKRNIFIVISLFLSGCALLTPSTINLPPTVEKPVQTSEVLSSTLPASISSIMPAETATPVTLDEKYEILTALYENNGGCQLPCFLGIMPGESSWTDISIFLGSLGEIVGPGGTDKVPNYSVEFDIDGPVGKLSPILWVKDNVIVAIGINSEEVSADFDYSLSGLLNSFDEPEEVWIRPIFDASDSQPFYYLVLMYQSKGIIAELTGNIENQNGDLVICPQDIFSRSIYPPKLFLWNPKEQVEFNNFGKKLIDSDLGWVTEEYQPLREVSADNLTNMEFYEIYRDPNTEYCINVLPVR